MQSWHLARIAFARVSFFVMGFTSQLGTPPAAPESELDRLQAFNNLFGDIAWEDRDRVGKMIADTIPSQVAADAAFRNARRNSDEANARIEHDKVLARIVTSMVKDDAELFKQFFDNEDFRRWMTATVFERSWARTEAP